MRRHSWVRVGTDILDPLCSVDRLPEKDVLDIFFSSGMFRRIYRDPSIDIASETERLRSLTSGIRPLKEPIEETGRYGWAVFIVLDTVDGFSAKYGKDPEETYWKLRDSWLMDNILTYASLWQVSTPEENFQQAEPALCQAFRIKPLRA